MAQFRATRELRTSEIASEHDPEDYSRHGSATRNQGVGLPAASTPVAFLIDWTRCIDVKKILPIGIQTFRDIREEGCYYVDKTEFIRRLVDEGSHYFVKFTFLTGSEQVLHGRSLLGAQKPLRHHAACPLLVRLRLHRRGSGHGVRAGARRSGPDAIREWYNGYNWRGPEKVYNPFDILQLFFNREFDAYWFETGTPSFLIETLSRRGVGSPNPDGMLGSNALLSKFDVDGMATEALLFQTGYLTTAGVEDLGGSPLFRLGYPNREVRQSLNESLLDAMLPDSVRHVEQGVQLRRLLGANDFEGLEVLFRAFFSGIPHDWHRKNDGSRGTRATTPACSTRTSRPRAWMSRWRTAPVTAVWTWRCASRGTTSTS